VRVKRIETGSQEKVRREEKDTYQYTERIERRPEDPEQFVKMQFQGMWGSFPGRPLIS